MLEALEYQIVKDEGDASVTNHLANRLPDNWDSALEVKHCIMQKCFHQPLKIPKKDF